MLARIRNPKPHDVGPELDSENPGRENRSPTTAAEAATPHTVSSLHTNRQSLSVFLSEPKPSSNRAGVATSSSWERRGTPSRCGCGNWGDWVIDNHCRRESWLRDAAAIQSRACRRGRAGVPRD